MCWNVPWRLRLSAAQELSMPFVLAWSRTKGCVATFKNQHESDWLGRPSSVSCSHPEQMVDELNLSLKIRTVHPPCLSLSDHVVESPRGISTPRRSQSRA